LEEIWGIYDLNKEFKNVNRIEDVLLVFKRFISERYGIEKYFFLLKKVVGEEINFEKYSSGFNLEHSYISSINLKNLDELEELFYLRKRIYIKNFKNAKRFHKLYAYFPSEEFISLPIISEEQNIGLLILFSDTSQNFPNLFKKDLNILSQFIDGVLKKSLLYEQKDSLSKTDSLTKISSRRFFNKEIERIIEHSSRNRSVFSLALFDIDHFKDINDRYGHQFGDSVLIEMVNLVSSHLTRREIFCRFGGEEFVIIFPDIPSDYALKVLKTLKSEIELHEFLINGISVKLTVSFGVSSYPISGPTSKEIIRDSDSALYFAKLSGRNKIVLYSEKMS